MDDNFTNKAISDAMKSAKEDEAKAFSDFYKKQEGFVESLAFNFAFATATGPEKFAKLISLAKEAGVDDTLREYRCYSMMRGFNGGYEAGRLSMLEEPKK